MMDKQAMIRLRMERQQLYSKIDNHKDYEHFFRLIQPVTPMFFSAPGEPPTLVHRTIFNDKDYNDKLRSRRTIIKGRFQNGNVGYVYVDDIELYTAVYKKDLILDFKHEYILKLIRQEGPLTIHQIKEISGMLSKEITPILHDLQKAFLVYEDQISSDLERGWYLFETEFNVNINRYTKADAIAQLIKKTLYLIVFANMNHLKGWLRLTNKDIKQGLDQLIGNKEIVELCVDGISGYCLTSDLENIKNCEKNPLLKHVYVLHKSDFLVKAYEQELKDIFEGKEVLQYILIDGEFKDAVCGHWRIGPHDVEDIVVLLNETEIENRKVEIINAVKLFYDEPFSKIIKYNGKEI